MARYKLLIEYDGGPYNGFQAQAGQPSVQGSLERAVAGFCGETVRVHAAGRTDSGVHATGQVVHFETEKPWPAETVRNAVNAHLRAEPIVVLDSWLAEDDFHARFSAKGRRYLYRILNRPAPPALERGKVWHVKNPLDAEAMHAAAQRLVGKHDFTTFRSTECQAKSPDKTLDRLDVSRAGDEIHVTAVARSFLHNQVRSMVGSLEVVGNGKWQAADLARALAARDRSACGPVAPPEGLYLVRVDY